ncbi:hypothetical protein QQ045_000185 [Rhodiola kirilowii]
MASTKVQRIMTQPINLIFRFLQSKARIQIWLFEQKDLRIEGRIIGFDEYMNLVLDDAEEVNVKKNIKKPLGDCAFSFIDISTSFHLQFSRHLHLFSLNISPCMFRENPSQRRQHYTDDEHMGMQGAQAQQLHGLV